MRLHGYHAGCMHPDSAQLTHSLTPRYLKKHHASTKLILLREASFCSSEICRLKSSYSEKSENRSVASQYYIALFEVACPALPTCFVMLQADEAHRQ